MITASHMTINQNRGSNTVSSSDSTGDVVSKRSDAPVPLLLGVSRAFHARTLRVLGTFRVFGA